MEIESKIAVLGIEGPIQDRVLVLIPMCQVSRAISSRCLGKMPWPPSDMSMRPGSLDHDFYLQLLGNTSSRGTDDNMGLRKGGETLRREPMWPACRCPVC